MAALTIPDAGLQLESSPSSRDLLPMQAFGITLDDGMIEDMIRCVRGGQNVELTLGSAPSFHYGSREEKVLDAANSINYDVYLTDPADPGNKIQRLPHPTMSIFKKPPTSLSTKKTSKVTTKLTSRASSAGADSDADARAGSHPQKNDKGSKFASGGSKGTGKLLPTGRSAMANVLSGTTNRSLPSSPALNGVSSPNPAFSASQQVLEKNKGQRSVLVHELAVRDQSYQHLQDVWTGVDSDLKPTVEKVADFNKSTEKWSLKKIYWKELDVWNYEYGKPEDRQSAIDNAVKLYDKQRVVLSDPAWDRLLPREDRNKGIVLSKLQATIAKQNTISPAPKIPTKAENGNKSDIDSSKNKGEASKSNPRSASSKPKKISDREAQAKRLLSNNPKKPAPKKPTSKVKATEEKGKRVLSEEFVYDTDTSEEDTQPSQTTTTVPKPKVPPKTTAKAAAKISEKPKEPPAPRTALKPKPKPIVRAPRAPVKAPVTANKSPQKHPREDEDSSSSSGAPLSKRIKPKQPPSKSVTEPPKITKHRASDASQNSRGTNSTTSSSLTMKSKNTSPIKSSPLATSPPTNASDFDERPSSQRPPNNSHQHPTQQRYKGEQDRERERGRSQAQGSVNGVSTSSSTTSHAPSTSVAIKKRKGREAAEESPDTTPTPPTKKPRISKDILMQARKFTRFYESYETLHHEIAAMKDPPEEKLADLLEMRERLVTMKRDIQRAVAAGA
ncbi:hypothetical protein F4861DRAFT_519544 [Xylaria intraflava]|nr:hypothetical protein F4861DRAFT_519544 [Xylaria intraflava]